MARSRIVSLGLAVLGALMLTALASASGGLNDWPYASKQGDDVTYTLATVGDIACEPDTPANAGNPASLQCNSSKLAGGTSALGGMPAEYATAQQAYAMQPDLVALLGDEQYEVGKLSDFEASFEQTWGGLKMLERPAPGNHEYYEYTKHGDKETPGQNGVGYFSYFNGHGAPTAPDVQVPNARGQAGDDTSANQGWYSYNLGNWHIISLNIECGASSTVKPPPFNGDCSTTDGKLLSQETSWLKSDLSSNERPCTIAYWHQPTFSATTAKSKTVPDPSAPGVGSGEGLAADAWWQLLYNAHATLILNGHEHVYARFKPMDPTGTPDPAHGVTQITIGTGGEDLDSLAPSATRNPNVVTGQDQAFGVMKLSLHSDSASWSYKPALAGPNAINPTTALSYSDSGSVQCQGGGDGND